MHTYRITARNEAGGVYIRIYRTLSRLSVTPSQDCVAHGFGATKREAVAAARAYLRAHKI